MKTIIQKPHWPFLFAVPVLLILAFTSADDAFVFNVHDTYYAISNYHMFLLPALVCAFYALFYWFVIWSGKIFSKHLTTIHLLITFGAPLLILLLNQFYSDDILNNSNNIIEMTVGILIVLILLAQILFPINVVYALIRNPEKNT